MTALADIKAAVARVQFERERSPVPLFGRHPPLRVLVGDSARRAICAETSDHKVPREIDGVPVVATNAFPGFSVEGAPPDRAASSSAG